MYRLQPIAIQIKGILSVSVLRAFTMALLSPVFAFYLKEYLHTDFHVSLIYTFSYLFSLIATIFGSVIVEYLQKRKTIVLSLILYALVIFGFTVFESSPSIVILFILYTFLFTVLFFAISLYIDKLSTASNLATHFGENGMLTNFSWIVGPMLGGFIASQLSYNEVFMIASLFALIALLIFIFSEPKERHKHHHHVYILRNIRSFFKNKKLRGAYIQAIGFCIFYGASALNPLFFEEIGASVAQIGLYLGLSTIPWIILELPVGKWADRTHKEYRLFIATYAILVPALILLGLSRNPLLAFFFLTVTSAATALSETTVLSSFYRLVKKNDVEKSSVFLTYPNLGIFIGTLFASVILSVTKMHVVYIILGVFMVPFFINALKSRTWVSKASNSKG